MIDGLVELVLEVLLQGGAELIIEVASHKRRKKHLPPKPLHPFAQACLWLMAGLAVGGVSLWLFPHSFIQSPALRLANLVVTPLVLGALMALIGRKRLADGQELVSLDRFSNAALFALGMGFVRYMWAV